MSADAGGDVVADACATRLADILSVCVHNNKVDSDQLKNVLRDRWIRISALAHAIQKDPLK